MRRLFQKQRTGNPPPSLRVIMRKTIRLSSIPHRMWTMMKRGDIWTVSGGNDYAGKPRPVVIVQDDRFDATASITVCALTSDPTDAPLFRLSLIANTRNGLHTASRIMVDKITTVPKSKLGRRIGELDERDIARLDRAIVVFLGLTLA